LRVGSLGSVTGWVGSVAEGSASSPGGWVPLGRAAGAALEEACSMGSDGGWVAIVLSARWFARGVAVMEEGTGRGSIKASQLPREVT